MKVQFPKCCRDCPAYREEEEDEFWGLCVTCSFVLSTNGDTKHEVIDGIDINTMRMPFCPLPPPSHGRLIDADKFVEEARKEYADCWNNGPTGSWMGWHDAAIRAENAPTIIEASE